MCFRVLVQRNHLFCKTNTQKTVAKVNNLYTEEKPSLGDVSCPTSEFIYIYFSFMLFMCFFPCLEWKVSCIGTEIPMHFF